MKGEEPEKMSGGHCRVNWSTTCWSKDKGGLGTWNGSREPFALDGRGLNGETKKKGPGQN